ncbi:hypothetical protein BJX96DRAFT_164037 [Aspergillus floccosus]
MYYQPGVTDHSLPHDPIKFNNLAFDPLYVMFSSNQTVKGGYKNTQSSYSVDEFVYTSVSKKPATTIDVSIIAESPLPGNQSIKSVDVVIGRVVTVYIKDKVLTDRLLDICKTLLIARCGYYKYAVIRETFDMKIPGRPADMMYRLRRTRK